VDVQLVDGKKQTTREDKRQDIDHFFLDAVFEDMDGKSRKYRLCNSARESLLLWFTLNRYS
jgi:hypothetical protein